MKIELQKVESDWCQSSLGCYISLNNTLIDVITPLNNPHVLNTVEVSNQGVLRLVVRDMGRSDGYLGSVSISVPLLNSSQSPLTLPLFDSPSGDTLNSIPLEIESPYIKLSFTNDYSDDEIYLPKNEVKSDNKSDIVLASKFSICSDEDLLAKTSNFNICEEKKIEGLEIFQIEIENLREELLKEKDKSKLLEEKYLDLLQKFKENCIRAQARENSLLELIAEKEEKLNKNLEINIELQNSLRNLAFENKMMTSKAEKFERQEEYVKQLEDELRKYQELLKFAEKAKDELTSTLIEFTQNEDPDISFKNSNVLKEKNQADSSDDCFKAKLLNTLPKAAQSSVFKVKDFCYKINDLQVSLALCDEGIYAKSKTTLIPLNEYLEKHKLSGENEPKPAKNFLRGTESSINRMKIDLHQPVSQKVLSTKKH